MVSSLLYTAVTLAVFNCLGNLPVLNKLFINPTSNGSTIWDSFFMTIDGYYLHLQLPLNF